MTALELADTLEEQVEIAEAALRQIAGRAIGPVAEIARAALVRIAAMAATSDEVVDDCHQQLTLDVEAYRSIPMSI